jgi:putative FmdB family regulatory protein
MPTYEYRCQDCRKRVSIYQTYEEYGRAPVSCPRRKQSAAADGRVRCPPEDTGFDRWRTLRLGNVDEEDPAPWPG